MITYPPLISASSYNSTENFTFSGTLQINIKYNEVVSVVQKRKKRRRDSIQWGNSHLLEETAHVTQALSLNNKIKGNPNVESSRAFDIRVKIHMSKWLVSLIPKILLQSEIGFHNLRTRAWNYIFKRSILIYCSKDVCNFSIKQIFIRCQQITKRREGKKAHEFGFHKSEILF